MAIAQVEIRGEKEMQRILQLLPVKMSRKLQLKALRMGASPMIKAARAAAPKRTKTLAKSIGAVNDKNRNGAAVWVAVRTGRKVANDGWYGWFVHGGTRGVGKRTKRTRNSSGGSVGTEYSKSGTAGNSGIKANPFFQTAWDNTQGTVFDTIRRTLAEVVVNFLRDAAPKYYGK